MPELAEVEYFRKRWHQAATGQCVKSVLSHGNKKLFRNAPAVQLKRSLTGARLRSSSAAAKQMLFKFSGDVWLGLHLGMTGELRVEPKAHVPLKHDHLVLCTSRYALVFSDPRMFGKILFHQGREAPSLWTQIAPAILSDKFTKEEVAVFLRRRTRAPIKAVLLMQERFPGVGNWMADEILWRARIHPRSLAGSLDVKETHILWRECRRVCRMALHTIAGIGDYLPPDLNAHIPDTWLFNHRWANGGRCPKTGQILIREEIGGRTSCWSPGRQSL